MNIDIRYIGVKKSDFEELVLSCYRDGSSSGLLRTGEKGRWTLYLRKMLYETEGLSKSSRWFSSIMDGLNIRQVVAGGFGAIPLVGGILASSDRPRNGAFVRERRKKYGFKEIIEGVLDKNEEILVVDDILNTGGACVSLLKVLQSEGVPMANVRVAVLANFEHGRGENKLKKIGIKHKLIKAMEITQK